MWLHSGGKCLELVGQAGTPVISIPGDNWTKKKKKKCIHLWVLEAFACMYVLSVIRYPIEQFEFNLGPCMMQFSQASLFCLRPEVKEESP